MSIAIRTTTAQQETDASQEWTDDDPNTKGSSHPDWHLLVTPGMAD
jgi:hypothetical protein